MCYAKGCGFLAVLVWNRVSISTILVWNRVWFVHSSFELGMFIRRISYFFIIWRWDHFPYNVYANCRVRAVTASHALRSRAGLQGFTPPSNFSGSTPRALLSVLGQEWGGGGHCARRSLRTPWKLWLRIVAWWKPRMFLRRNYKQCKILQPG